MELPISDPRIKIKVTSKAVDFIQSINSTDEMPSNIKDIRNGSIVHLSAEDARWLKRHLSEGNYHCYLHELLAGCEVVLPRPEIQVRSPELEARVQKLKYEQAEMEYRRMTKDVDGVRRKLPEDTIAYQISQINRQLIAVFQFVVSIVCAFVFGFMGIELVVGSLDFGFRLLLGVICGLVVTLAEIYFLAKQLSEDMVPPENQKEHAD